jgi:hypothetical protein
VSSVISVAFDYSEDITLIGIANVPVSGCNLLTSLS